MRFYANHMRCNEFKIVSFFFLKKKLTFEHISEWIDWSTEIRQNVYNTILKWQSTKNIQLWRLHISVLWKLCNFFNGSIHKRFKCKFLMHEWFLNRSIMAVTVGFSFNFEVIWPPSFNNKYCFILYWDRHGQSRITCTKWNSLSLI